MSKLRRQLSANTSNVVETRNLTDIKAKTGNLYESIAIVAKRANQINIALKKDCQIKLKEFPTHTEGLKEIQEIKKQIKFPKPYNAILNLPCLLTQDLLEVKIITRR